MERRTATRHRIERRQEEFDAAKKLQLLPTSATNYFRGDANVDLPGWSPHVRTVLAGVRDNGSVLSALDDSIVSKIFDFIIQRHTEHVRMTVPASLLIGGYDIDYERVLPARITSLSQQRWRPRSERVELLDDESIRNAGFVSFARCGQVDFPQPADRNVNMMPFILGDQDSMPIQLQCYHELIMKCPFSNEEAGKVAYLTVQESFVNAGETQRRPGIHIEVPGGSVAGMGEDSSSSSLYPGIEWGCGMVRIADQYEGGIYTASTVSDTLQVYDALITDPVRAGVNRHGGCQHLQNILDTVGTKVQAGQLVWMTDRTPHQALPQAQPGMRQFFRLVMPRLSVWYADHSTPNPNVSLPESVRVIHGSKFSS